MNEITSIENIQDLVRAGCIDWKPYGDVSVSPNPDGDLLIFNYTPAAQYAARWNFFERVSRGLIIHRHTGEIVARAFDKFFNWGEREMMTTEPIVSVTEKMDGSLGILYRHDSQYKIATRGSFVSDQAKWATAWLQANMNHVDIDSHLTPLFEIIYPENRIVLDYADRAELVLLAVRDRFTGEYLSRREVANIADAIGVKRVDAMYFPDTDLLIEYVEGLDGNREGFVVEFADGQRFKFKGPEYLRLHKLISGLSFKNTLECIALGKLEETRAVIPDEFAKEFDSWVSEIQNLTAQTCGAVEEIFAQAPRESRKDFAVWTQTNHKPHAPYLFALLDGKPIEPLIYKHMGQNHPLLGRRALRQSEATA